LPKEEGTAIEAGGVAAPGAAGYEGSAGGTGGKAEGKAGSEKGGRVAHSSPVLAWVWHSNTRRRSLAWC